MNWQTLLHLLSTLISLGISITVGFHALRSHTPGAKPFGWTAILQTIWGVSYLLEFISPGLLVKIFWDNVQWVIIGLIPVTFLGFTLRYTGRVTAQPYRLYTLLSLPALILALLLFTNDLHGLAIQNTRLIAQEPYSILLYDITPAIIGFGIYFYILLLAGVVYLLSYFVYSQGSLRTQIYIIIIGSAIPMAGGILTLLGWMPESMQSDISPYTFAAGNILISLALFRYRILQAVPLARNILFEQMREGMIVLDDDARIVDINPAATNMLGLEGVQTHGLFAFDMFRLWPHLVEQIHTSKEGQATLIVGSGQGSRQYTFFLSRLNDKLGSFVGHLITLRELETVPVSEGSSVREVTQVTSSDNVAARANQKDNDDVPIIRWLKHFFYPPALKELNLPPTKHGMIWHQSLEQTTTGLIRMSFLVAGMMLFFNKSAYADFPQAYRFLQILSAGLGILAVFRSIPFSIRKIGFILILYLFGVTENFIFGFTAEGFNAYLVVMVGAGVLLSGRTRWATIFINIVTILTFYIIIKNQLGLPLAGEYISVLTYQVSRASSSVLSLIGGAIGLSLATITIWETASKVWRKEKQTSNLLQKERDLLEQRVAERSRELSESEAKYRSLIEQLPVTIYRDKVDIEGVNIYFSPQIENMFGYSLQEWQENPILWHSLIYPEDYEEAKKSLSEVLENGRATVEYRVLHKNGSLVWIRDDSILVRNDAGVPLFVQGSMLNITEQKIEAFRRREADEMIRHVLENLNEVFWITDAKTGKDIYISESVITLWGRSADELINIPNAFLDSVLEEDRPVTQNIWARHARGEKTEVEYRIVKPDGSIRWIWDRSFPLPTEMDGRPRIAGFSSDITDLKHAQQQKEALAKEYHDLFEQSPVSLWEEDFSEVKKLLDGLAEQGVTDYWQYFEENPEFVDTCIQKVKIIKINKATEHIYEAENKADVLNHFARSFKDQSLAEFKVELLNIAQGTLQFNWIAENLTLAGNRIHVHNHWSVLPGYESTLARVLLSVTDITSEIEARNILKRQGEEYKALSQIAVDLLERRSLDQLLQTAVNQASFLLDAEFVEITLKEGDQLVVRGFTSNLPFLKNDVVNRQEAKLTWKAVDTCKPVILDDYSNWNEKREIYNPLQLQAVAIFPILKGNECIGTLDASRNVRGYTFTESQVQLGIWFTHILAMVLDNMQLLETANLRVSALNAAANAIMITDENGMTEWVNPAFTSLTGYTFEEMIGKIPFETLTIESASQDFFKEMFATLRAGKVWNGEISSQRKNEEKYIQETTITPLFTDNGNISRFIAIMQDITSRKEMEKKLAESEQLYRSVVESMSEGIVIQNTAGQIIAHNKAAEGILGLSHNELMGRKSIDPRWHTIYPDGTPIPGEEHPAMRTLRSGEPLQDVIMGVHKPNGELSWISVNSQPIIQPGNPKTNSVVATFADITERKSAEEQLRESEKKYRELINKMSDTVWVIDFDMNILDVNDAASTVLGYTREELLSIKVSEIDASLTTEQVAALINKVPVDKTQRFSTQHKTKDGRIIPVEVSSSLVLYMEETAILSIARDISDRIKAEEQIRASEERYRLLYENMEDVVYQTDYHGVITTISPSVTHQAGYLPDEIVGKHASMFYAIPEELNALDALIVSRGSVNDYEARIKKKDGEVVYVSITVRTIFDKNGTPAGTEGIMRNIHRRKQVEERILRMNLELEERVIERTAEIEQTNQYLSALLDTAIILNKNLNLEDLLDRVLLQAKSIIHCRAANLMLIEGDHAYIARRQGYKELEEIERNLMSFKLHLEWPTFEKMLKTRKGIYIRDTLTEPSWQKISSSEWVRAYIGIPLFAGETNIGFLNFSHDHPDFFSEKDILLLEAFANHVSIAIENSRLLEEIKTSFAKEKDLRDRLVQSDKLAALGKMVAVIAHEINNPIQTVKNSFYLLKDLVPQDGMGREYLNIASAEANRISNLVLQLREAYRPRLKHFEPVNIPDLLREVHALVMPQLNKNQVVCFQNDVPQQYIVKGIRDNLKQVFINLSMNAIEAMSVNKGGVIQVDFVIRDNKTLGIMMNNTGPLIPTDALSSIFDPFFTTKESGGGLGLSIAFDIVKQHKGEITVENNPDKGVIFTVWLPLANNDQSEK